MPPEFDVDSRDLENPMCVADYAMDIHRHNRKIEGMLSPSPTYIRSQPDINEKMRAILIDWLVEVHLKFKLMSEVLPLTVNLIDRYLEKRTVMRSKLQLVGVTGMLIASKYEEIYAPEVRDFVYITDRAYTREEILQMESDMLNTLQFQCTVPTVHYFMHRYIKVAGLDRRGTTAMLARYLCERTLQEYAMLKYLPSTVAAACVHLALRKTGKPSWTPALQYHTNYTEANLRPCAEDVAQIAATAETTSLKAVRHKYSSSRFGCVGSISWTRAPTAAGEASLQ